MDYADLGTLERIAALIQTQNRQAAARAGLQAVHYDILAYLAQANRWSNSPMAAAHWLGLTKGTVSQSISLLEEKGYLERKPDPDDARRQQLFLTARGLAVVEEGRNAMRGLLGGIEINGAYTRIFRTILNDVLWQLQERTGRKGFGVCGTCKHHKASDDGALCALKQEKLAAGEKDKICRTHEFAN